MSYTQVSLRTAKPTGGSCEMFIFVEANVYLHSLVSFLLIWFTAILSHFFQPCSSLPLPNWSMILTLVPPYGPCIHVSESSRILNTWHDPTGHLSRSSHCEIHDIPLYMGSYNHWGIGRLYLAAELPEKMKNDRPFYHLCATWLLGQRIFKDDVHKKNKPV